MFTTLQLAVNLALIQKYDNGYDWLVVVTIQSFPLITSGRTFNKINTMGANRRAGTAQPSGVSEFTPVFRVVHVVQSLVFCVVFCRSLSSSVFLLVIVLFVPRFVASGYTPLVSLNFSSSSRTTDPLKNTYFVSSTLYIYSMYNVLYH